MDVCVLRPRLWRARAVVFDYEVEHPGQLKDCLQHREWYGQKGEKSAHHQAHSLETASKVRVLPRKGKGKGEMVNLDSKVVSVSASC